MRWRAWSPSVVEAGYDLGGSRWTVLRRIVIPHAMPGIVAGSIIVFMLTVGNFATPVLLGGKNGLWFTEQIYAQFITRFNWPQGAAFGMLLLLLSSAIVWAGPAPHRPEPRHHLEAGLIAMNRPSFTWKLYIAAFYLFLFAPLLVVAIFAFNASPFPSPPWRGFTLEWFTGTGAVFGKPGVLMDPIWLSSIGNSFKVAIPVALLAVLIGTVNAWVLERARVSRQDLSRHDDALAPRHPRRGARHLDPGLLLARGERARGLASDGSRSSCGPACRSWCSGSSPSS